MRSCTSLGCASGCTSAGSWKAAESLTMLLDCCHAQVGLLEPQMQARLRAVEKKLGLSDWARSRG